MESGGRTDHGVYRADVADVGGGDGPPPAGSMPTHQPAERTAEGRAKNRRFELVKR
jgi:hypothetical protein